MPAELKGMFYRQDVQNMTWSALADTDLTEGIGRLDQPVLVLYGKDDPFGRPMAEATTAALAAARVELVLLERCGHYWHECPDQFYPRVRAFLSLNASP